MEFVRPLIQVSTLIRPKNRHGARRLKHKQAIYKLRSFKESSGASRRLGLPGGAHVIPEMCIHGHDRICLVKFLKAAYGFSHEFSRLRALAFDIPSKDRFPSKMRVFS